jgi:ubiquinone/menaquinone biosynthesis C-methylase UbiE
MSTRDFFSDQSKSYATFRPTYPEELYQFIFLHLRDKMNAWDCATGNGQVAQRLCTHFKKVYGTDISQKQIDYAYPADNIEYAVGKAEQTTFPDDHFDLITVAQALHWIDTSLFYKEALRTAKPGALLAVWGYSLLSFDSMIDPVVEEFYHKTVGQYWDNARKSVEEHYRNIPFPFAEIPSPTFELKVNWSLDQFTGYLSSWSATQAYFKVHGHDPVEIIKKRLQQHWKDDETKAAAFPLFLRLGRIHP